MKLEQYESEVIKRISGTIAKEEDTVRNVFRGLLTNIMTDLYGMYDTKKEELKVTIPHIADIIIKVKQVKESNKKMEYVPYLSIEPTLSFSREIHRVLNEGESFLEEIHKNNIEKSLYDIVDVKNLGV